MLCWLSTDGSGCRRNVLPLVSLAVRWVYSLCNTLPSPPNTSGWCRLWISQHGDLPSEEVMSGMEAEDRDELLNLLTLGISAVADPRRDAVIICHSVPGDMSRVGSS